MTDPTQDRSHFRCLPDSGLIAKGKESGNELAIALAERLEDASNAAEDDTVISSLTSDLHIAETNYTEAELANERLTNVLRGMTITIENALIAKP
jgi:hypothetical protein